MEKINLHSLVLLVGPSGAGKSTLAANHFAPHEIVSSDTIRAEMLGDLRIQSNQDDIWTEVHRRVRQRLAWGQRVVVDATNLRFRDRKVFIDMSKHFAVDLVYLVVNRTVKEKLATAGWRADVPGLIQRHDETFKSNAKAIYEGDGVARVIELKDNTQLFVVNHPVKGPNGVLTNGTVDRVPQAVDGRIMVIGDVHGNTDELKPMLRRAREDGDHVLFLGDIVDYGEHNIEAVDIAYDLIRQGHAHMVWGNHERKLSRWIDASFGRDFKGVIGPGLAMTVLEIQEGMSRNPAFKDRFIARWRCLAAHSRQHYVLGDHLFTHGAATPEMWNMQGRHTLPGETGNMAFFGEVDPDKPMRDDGMPNRTYRWIDQIPGGKTVVVGHDPRDKAKPMVVTNANGGRAVFLDTGSSKGGKLSCMVL